MLVLDPEGLGKAIQAGLFIGIGCVNVGVDGGGGRNG